VDRDPWPTTYDRDVDVPPRGAAGSRGPIDAYRPLVANPLLAVAICVLAIVLLRASLQARNLTVFLIAIGLLSISSLFTQFHCLDCGKTSWLYAARLHACPAILARWREGRRPRWRWPRLKTQIILWLYFLASSTVLIVILFMSSR
jgi:hypothetical protein